MNLPKIICYFAIVLFVFKCDGLFSQKDSSVKKYRISIDAAFITNSAYSHYMEPEGTSRHITESISTNSNSLKYLPGVSLGTTLILGNPNRSSFIFGISCSLTNANYHYHYSSFAEGGSYSGTYDITNKNVISSYVYLNYELGYRIRLGRRFRLQPSLLINQNLVIFQKENGDTRHVEFSYLNYPSGPVPIYNRETYATIHTKTTLRTGLESSLRLSLFYKFNIGKHTYNIFASRNFGIKSRLPWWAIGISRFL